MLMAQNNVQTSVPLRIIKSAILCPEPLGGEHPGAVREHPAGGLECAQFSVMFNQYVDDSLIERHLLHLFKGARRVYGIAVRTFAYKRLENIDYRNDLRFQRYFFPFQTIRITGTVFSFVMMQHNVA